MSSKLLTQKEIINKFKNCMIIYEYININIDSFDILDYNLAFSTESIVSFKRFIH